MTLRKILLLVCILLVLPLSVPASESPQIYTIKKGDTLWGISDRFLKDPYYWPNLWSHNPEVPNPHFIYPGQKLAIYDGRIEIITAEPEVVDTDAGEMTEPVEITDETPAVVVEQPIVEPQDEITIKIPGGGIGIIAKDESGAHGRIIDATDSRLIIGTGETVFLEMKDLDATIPGTRYYVYSLGDKVKHPVTGENLGYHVVEHGALDITDVHDEVASAVIVNEMREIMRGNYLHPYQYQEKEITLKRQDKQLSGFLVASLRGQTTLGQFDVIYTDIGAADGLEKGNLVYLSRPRKASETSIADLKLPDVLVGEAVILDVRETISAALILKVVNNAFIGDHITTISE